LEERRWPRWEHDCPEPERVGSVHGVAAFVEPVAVVAAAVEPTGVDVADDDGVRIADVASSFVVAVAAVVLGEVHAAGIHGTWQYAVHDGADGDGGVGAVEPPFRSNRSHSYGVSWGSVGRYLVVAAAAVDDVAVVASSPRLVTCPASGQDLACCDFGDGDDRYCLSYEED